MNYQVSSLTRTITLLFFLIGFAFCLFGISALLTYSIVVGLFFRRHIHAPASAQRNGPALTLTEDICWITYIHGFPLRSRETSLRILFLVNRKNAAIFRCFASKMILQAACIAILACDVLSSEGDAVTAILALLALLFLLICQVKAPIPSICSPRISGSANPTTSGGSIWYQGFLPKKRVKTSLLARLF
ncbi:MAG: hypothetical protein ACLR17_20275 [Enterobacteriaceae bacterium]